MNHDNTELMFSIAQSLEGINSRLERIAEVLEDNLGQQQDARVTLDVETHNMLSCSLGNIFDAITELKGKKNA